MTGYGRGTCEVAGRRLVIELRSLNHRFLELKLRLPWSDAGVEQLLTQALRARIDRGVVTVTVREEGGGNALAVRADLELARGYAKALEEVRSALGLMEPVTLALVAQQPGVLAVGERVLASDDLWAQLKPGVAEALDQLLEARAREGATIAEDLKARTRSIEKLAHELRELAREAPQLYRKRIEERLTRALGPGGVEAALDPARLAQEVAILADRIDVTEELTRMAAHLVELTRVIDNGAPAGRRLDFLTQELNREVNTIGSKCQSAPCAARVVETKAELERLREQIQNVE